MWGHVQEDCNYAVIRHVFQLGPRVLESKFTVKIFYTGNVETVGLELKTPSSL